MKRRYTVAALTAEREALRERQLATLTATVARQQEQILALRKQLAESVRRNRINAAREAAE